MAKPRLELHKILTDILGSEYCYFTPPSKIPQTAKRYIIYELDNATTSSADNINYQVAKRYTVTLIERNPDSELVDKLLELPYCSFDRHFIVDNLHHYIFTIFF